MEKSNMRKTGSIVLWIVASVLVIVALYSLYNRIKPEITSRLNPQQNIENTQDSDETTVKDKTANEKDGQKEPDREIIMASDFTLKDLEGKTVKLSDFRGKIVVLNFWATWCPPCREELPDLDEVSKELAKGEDAVFLGVNITDGIRDTESKVQKFVKDNKLSMQVLLDHGGKVASMEPYVVEGIPTTFFINRDGSIYGKIPGATDKETIMKIIDQIK